MRPFPSISSLDDTVADMSSEGVSDLEALKAKVMAPSVKQALKAKQSVKQYKEDKAREEQEDKAMRAKQNAEAAEAKRQKRKQEGDGSGIKVRRRP